MERAGCSASGDLDYYLAAGPPACCGRAGGARTDTSPLSPPLLASARLSLGHHSCRATGMRNADGGGDDDDDGNLAEDYHVDH